MRSRKLLVGVLAIALLGGASACTDASAGDSAGQPSGAAAFNPATVSKDASLAAQVPASIRSTGTLVFASDTSTAPAESLAGADGQTPVGYEVDLAKAIAAKLGLQGKVQTAQFGSILPAIGTKYDLGISEFTVTPTRMKAVNFVSYYNAGLLWAVQKGNPKNFNPDNYCGTSVGVQTGTAVETILENQSAKCVAGGKPAVKIISLKNQTDVTTRLVNGSLDAMPTDSPTTGYAVAHTGGQLQALGRIYNSAPEGIAVAKNDPAFATLVSKAINQLIADGSYKKILDGWGVGVGAITTSVVNPAVAS